MRITRLILPILLVCLSLGCRHTVNPTETKYIIRSMTVKDNGKVSYHVRAKDPGFADFFIEDIPGKYQINDTIIFMIR